MSICGNCLPYFKHWSNTYVHIFFVISFGKVMMRTRVLLAWIKGTLRHHNIHKKVSKKKNHRRHLFLYLNLNKMRRDQRLSCSVAIHIGGGIFPLLFPIKSIIRAFLQSYTHRERENYYYCTKKKNYIFTVSVFVYKRTRKLLKV